MFKRFLSKDINMENIYYEIERDSRNYSTENKSKEELEHQLKFINKLIDLLYYFKQIIKDYIYLNYSLEESKNV